MPSPPSNDAGSLIRLHERLLFQRAYPADASAAKQADAALFAFALRVDEWKATGGDLSAFEEGEVSGIAGTTFSAVFSYPVARHLAGRYPKSIEINWDAWDSGNAGAVLRRFLPLMDEDWPVEANVPYRDWIHASRSGDQTGLAWLLGQFELLPVALREKADLYDSLRLPVLWDLGDAPATRSHLRLPARKLFCHRGALLRRADVSIERELQGPPLPVTRVPRKEARRILDLIIETSAVRYRELYGFSHPDGERVYRAEAGRGVAVYFFGVPAEWRLPLRAYHCGMFFKNGVPSGYIEALSLFERSEVGFNLYYTFREGESAWIYARLLRLLKQMLGVTCFSVDPYQIGNDEALDSGAFWFYRKLGFRPLDADIAMLTEREERNLQRTPGYRSGRRTLEKLSRGYMLYGGTDWDRFRVRNIGLAAQQVERPHSDEGWPLVLSMIPDLSQWSRDEQARVAAIVEARMAGEESRYLRLMQRHKRLRTAILALGS